MARVYDEPTEDFETDPFAEPVVKPTSASGLSSVYDQVRSELSKPAVTETHITKRVPARPLFEVVFRTDLSIEQLDRWRINSRKKKNREDVDVLRFNEIVIASQCSGINFKGEPAVDDAGEPLTFRHKGLIEAMNALDTYGAIEAMYGRDADILRIGGEILEAAGYGDDDDIDPDDEEADPLGW